MGKKTQSDVALSDPLKEGDPSCVRGGEPQLIKPLSHLTAGSQDLRERC